MAINAFPFPAFQPARRIITAITNSFPATVTTSFAHQYRNGIIVRLDVPKQFGMNAINGLQGEIIVTSDTTFEIDIDTTHFNSFVVPVIPKQQAQVIPIAENNDIITSAVRNVLPYGANGTFI